ncbi:MAG: OB-fold nucleic acid binding domain-containing protein [Candidatus Limnocylindrales bacterium]
MCRLVSRANLAGTKSMPLFSHMLLTDNTDGVVALSGCREGEIARRLRAGDREGARAAAEHYARLFAARRARRDSVATSAFFLEMQHHLLPDDDWLVAETARLAEELGLPVVVTNDVHYAYPEGREMHDVLTAIRHGRTLDELRDLRRRDGESYLKTADELMAMPPGRPRGSPGRPRDVLLPGRPRDVLLSLSGARAQPVEPEADARTAAAWAEGIGNAGELAASCSVDLGFERYRFPGFPIPKSHTPFSYLEELCHEGARRRYHPISSPVVRQLAHELDVIERTGLAEFFLICWDIMRFARERGIPAQGRGSAANSIVAYVLGITRVDPIRHHLLFERFINEGRTSYPDIDIDFSSERREEVIQYVYRRYGPEHTGMVCNLVTYRARSAVREVGYALGFPRPLVDRVAKALETYDSVMVRRDLEADGGFGQFFADAVERAEATGVAGAAGAAAGAAGAGVGGNRTADFTAAEIAASHGLTDRMGQLNHPRGGRVGTGRGGAAGGAAGGAVFDTNPGEFLRDTDPGGATQKNARASGSSSGSDLVAEHDPRSATLDQRSDGPISEQLQAQLSTYHRPHRYTAEIDPQSGLLPGISGTAGAGAEPAVPYTDGQSVMEKGNDESRGGAGSHGVEAPNRRPLERNGADPGVSDGPEPANLRPQWLQQPGAPPPAAVALPCHSIQAYKETGGAEVRAATRVARASGLGPEAKAWPEAKAGPSVADLGGGSATEQGRRLERRRPVGSDDEGGPGDSPASIAWLAAERTVKAPARELEAGRQKGAEGEEGSGGGNPPATARSTGLVRPEPHSSVARVQSQPQIPPEMRRGSTAGMPEWERWLAFCARIDGFPRHLSIHSGGMLVTAAPLIDIAPLERATMQDRVVVQFDKRDVETIKLIKLDLLGLGMLAAIDETLQLIESDCAACIDLDRLPEDVPEVFEMLQAADTVGVFQVESRAQMQTLPKSKPANLDDLVVEVAIIRPGPIQGNAVHPYLRRRQGIEPVAYLHPSLEPVLRETLGVILYQEQVMQIAITVAGFSAGESDGFRRAMGTWRSTREMEKLHTRFVDGCRATNGLTDEQAEELFRQVAAFASFGFAKSHAAAFARTAYESAFLKLFYPAQFTVGLINAQPMGFYPVEVLINDARRHGVAILPVDINASTYKTATEWVGREGDGGRPGAASTSTRDPGPRIDRPAAVRSSGCIVPSAASRRRWTPETATGYGIRLGLALVKGIGDEHAERLDAELGRGPYHSLADVVARTELPEEVIERLIRAGALDSLSRPRRELLWQLREVMGATQGGERRTGRAAGRPMDLRLPPTPAPELPPLTERERLGDTYSVLSLDANRQVISLFRPALERLGAVTNASLADRGPGPVRVGGLVVTRQHPMTARGTVFLALEDETGMVNVTLWPDAWARLRGVVRHALLYVDGMLQREANVVNVIARDIKPLPAVAETVGGPARPEGVRALGYSGMRRG